MLDEMLDEEENAEDVQAVMEGDFEEGEYGLAVAYSSDEEYPSEWEQI